LVFRRNILAGNTGAVYQIYPWRADIVAESDGNIVFARGGQPYCAVAWEWEPWSAWCQREGGRYDARSQTVDPLLRSDRARGYWLDPLSPALRSGFSPLALDDVGLRRGRRR
jgi:hypothetical protein